jgi:hypothetical protein
MVGEYKISFDILRVIQFNGLPAKEVVSCFGDEGYVTSHAGNGNGLVGTLAARVHHKFVSYNCFARYGKPAGFDDHIGI